MARLGTNIRAAIAIVLLSVGAAVTYGILQDQVTAHVCVEYFTIGHSDFLNLGNPALIAVEWGVVATWWAGLLLGLPVAVVARIGTRRPPLSVRALPRPTLVIMGGVGGVALIAGVIGYVVARAGGLYLTGYLAAAVPAARHDAFLADLCAHDAAYAAGVLAAVALCVWAWRRRGTLARMQRDGELRATMPALTTRPATYREPPLQRWETVVLRLLLIVGGVSLSLGVLFMLALSMLSGL